MKNYSKKTAVLGILALAGTIAISGCASTSADSQAGISSNTQDLAKQVAELQKKLSSIQSSGGAQAAGGSGYGLVSANQSVIDPNAKGSLVVPPNAKPGECYATVCETKTATDRYVSREAGNEIQVTPAQFREGTKNILVKPAYTTYECAAPQFREEKMRVLIKPAVTRTEVVPAKYRTVTEKLLVKPATTVWKKTSELNDIERANQLKTQTLASGDVLCLVEVPAQYKEVKKEVLVSKATTREVQVSPAEYGEVTTYKLVEAGKAKRVNVAAENRSVKVLTQVAAAKVKDTPVAAAYETFTKQAPGACKPTFRSVLCDTNATESKIGEIQTALKRAGFDPGRSDGKVDDKTYEAIRAYQSSKGLPVDDNRYINVKTVESLGVRAK